MSIEGKKILITGGLGFIGFNAACHFAKKNQVHVADDCSRIGVERNIERLKDLNIGFSKVDISYFKEFREVYHAFQPDIVVHMAAQVAVTLSITNPVRDFRSNLYGSFNLLELARHAKKKPVIVYASTNKVYGHNEQELIEEKSRYSMKNASGLSEQTALSFETPYGCSKGAAEQYFLDYCKTYNIPTVVFRQSCIYGPHQYGMEDQGWLAWFVICMVFNRPITIFGDGKQVRDVLYVDDLVQLYDLSIEKIDSVKGDVFNIGGGPANTLSLLELVAILENATNRKLKISFDDWRLNDQKVYISGIDKIKYTLGWEPTTTPVEGVSRLMRWVGEEKDYIAYVNEQQQQSRSQFDVSIVIPAKNEEANIDSVLDEVEFFMSSSPFTYEIIVVNDRSTDKTAELAREFSSVKVIDNKNNPGKGAALRSGFDIATGKYLVMMDADYSHDASDLPAMLEEVKRHNGLVIGSRIVGGSEEYTRIRAFGNIVLTWLFGFCHGRYLSDALNGYKVFHREVYEAFEYTSDAYEIEIELLANTLRLKRQVTEIPSRERARRGGKAKSSVIRHGTRFAVRVILEYFRKPISKTPVPAIRKKFTVAKSYGSI